PAWSPDGKQIAFCSNRDGWNHIYIMDADGQNVKQITKGDRNCYAPSWKPDGKLIAFNRKGGRRDEICTVSPTGEDLQVLSASDDVLPAYSPDGKSIAFVSGRDEEAGWGLYRMDADGKNAKRLADNKVSEVYASPSWSPDGKWIAFFFPVGDGQEIHLIKADGTDQKMLTKSEKKAIDPAWSPDGKRIAFIIQEMGDAWKTQIRTALWVMDADGGNQKHLLEMDILSTVAWRPKQK
ncbi:MAG: LpqB family beta-propeller domain-containing protein, partial [Gemmataceae bacterium]